MGIDLSHRQLQSLIHVSNVLNSSLDTDQVIDSIMKETISVIAAADSGILFLYHEEEDILIAKSTFGINAEIFKNVRIKPGESMTGKTFLAKQCLAFPNQESIFETIDQSLTKETLYLVQSSRATYPHSAICAPILNKGHCIGVITLDSFNPTKIFTEDDLSLLKAISHQAAVILEKTRLYYEQEKSIHLLEDLNQTISKQNQRMTRSIDIHNSLADLVLHGKGLEAILHYISQFVGCPVFLIDSIGSTLVNTPHTKQTKQLYNLVEKQLHSTIRSYTHLKHSVEEIDINKITLTLLTFAIGAKPNFLGFLVIIASEPVCDEDIAAIEHACTVISLEMIKEQAIFETEHNLKGQFIDGLLSGEINEQLINQAQQLQLNEDRNFQVITIQLDKFHQPSMTNYQGFIQTRRHLLQLVRSIFLSSHPLGIVVSKNNHIIILISYNSGINHLKANNYLQERSEQFLQELQNRFKKKFHIAIGVGRMIKGLEHVHKSSEDSTKCIQFIKNFKLKKKIVHYSELGSRRLLLNNSEEELIDYVHEVLGPLIKYEKQHAKEFLHTLHMYLSHNQKMKETAESLHIHLNTLAYRLKRIEEIIGIDLSQSRHALDVFLAVSLYELLEAKIK